MDLEEGEIEMEDGEILDDSGHVKSSVPKGFWSTFSPPRPNKKHEKSLRGKYRLARRRPFRGKEKTFKSTRDYHTIGVPYEAGLSRDGLHMAAYRRRSDIPERANQYFKEPDYSSRKNRIRCNTSRYNSIDWRGEECYARPAKEAARRETFRHLENEIESNYDSDEYDVLIQRYQLIKETLNKLKERDYSDKESNKFDGCIYGKTDYDYQSVESDVKRQSLQRAHKSDQLNQLGRDTRKDANRFDSLQTRYQNSHVDTNTTEVLDVESRNFSNYGYCGSVADFSSGAITRNEVYMNNDDLLYDRTVQETGVLPEFGTPPSRFEDFPGDIKLTNTEKQFIGSMSQESYYMTDRQERSNQIEYLTRDVDLLSKCDPSPKSGIPECLLKNTLPNLDSTTQRNSVIETKKKKKRGKKINKRKRKAQALKLMSEGDSKQSATQAKNRTSLEVHSNLDSFITSCRNESADKDAEFMTYGDEMDNYQLVPMDLSGYSSENKLNSPVGENDNVLNADVRIGLEEKSEDEIDEHLLREQLLRSVATTRLKKAKELMAKNRILEAIPRAKKTTNADEELLKDVESDNIIIGKEESDDSGKVNDENEVDIRSLLEKAPIRKVKTVYYTRTLPITHDESSNERKASFVSFKLKSNPKRIIKYSDNTTPTLESNDVAATSAASDSCPMITTTSTLVSTPSIAAAPSLPEVSTVISNTEESFQVMPPTEATKVRPAQNEEKIGCSNAKRRVVTTKPKKVESIALQLPKHDPVVIQVGDESDTEEEENEESTTRGHVEDFLEGIKGELQKIESPPTSLDSTQSVEKSIKIGAKGVGKVSIDLESHTLTDSLLFGLQECLQSSKSKIKSFSEECVLDKARFETLKVDVKARQKKIEEQETKITKIFQQLLAARKLKRIFMNSLKDAEEKINEFETKIELKQFRLKSVEKETAKGDHILKLAKKELLKQRLRKMKEVDIQSPLQGSSQNLDEEEKAKILNIELQTRNRILCSNIKNLRNRLTFLVNNLTNVEGQIDAKPVIRKRKSFDSNYLTVPVRRKIKKTEIPGGLKESRRILNTLLSPQEKENEKTRLIKLERELRERIAKFQRRPNTVLNEKNSNKDHGSSSEETLKSRSTEKERDETSVSRKESDVLIPTVKSATILDLLQQEEKTKRMQIIYSERLNMPGRIRSTTPIVTNKERFAQPVCADRKFPYYQRTTRHTEQVFQKDVPTLTPLTHYKSVLSLFRSYRLSPYYRSKENLKLTSRTFSHKICPEKVICPFELHGKCLDDSCNRQHGSAVFSMTFKELLQDLLAYDTSRTISTTKGSTLDSQKEYIDSFVSQYQGKISEDEISLLLLNEIRKSIKLPETGRGYHIVFDRVGSIRTDGFSKGDKVNEEQDRGQLPGGMVYDVGTRKRKEEQVESPVIKDAELTESQEMRYFAETYNCVQELETALVNQPHEISLWISLSVFYEQECKKRNISFDKRADKALNALSRGLDKNPQSEELWYHYLRLYAKSRKYNEVRDMCFKASRCAFSFKVSWTCLEILKTFNDKRRQCLNMIEFLCNLDEHSIEPVSNQIVETVLYLTNLHFLSGNKKAALQFLLQALDFIQLGDTSSKLKVHSALSNCDMCFLWLVCIYAHEFSELPGSFFDATQGGLSRLTRRSMVSSPFMDISTHGVKRNEIYFQEAMRYICTSNDTCSGGCNTLIKSYIQFESKTKSKEGVFRILEKLHTRLCVIPGLCAEYFMLNATLLSVDNTINFGKSIIMSCSFCEEVTYTFCVWLLKSGRLSLVRNIILQYLHSKYDLPISDSRFNSLEFTTALFKRLLGQSVNLLGKLPTVVTECNSETSEYLYCCLIYCLNVEVLSDVGKRSTEVIEAFESVVTSYTILENRKKLWMHYLEYQLKNMNVGDEAGFTFLVETLQRLLVSVPCSEAIPADHTVTFDNYDFHNKAIRRCLPVISEESLPEFYQSMLKLLPDNVELGAEVCQFEFQRGNIEQARRIYGAMIPVAPHFIDIWKVAISVEASQKCYKEVRWLYQEAVKAVPFNSTLWKEYAQFEIAHGKDASSKEISLQRIFKSASEFGVNVEDFVWKIMQ